MPLASRRRFATAAGLRSAHGFPGWERVHLPTLRLQAPAMLVVEVTSEPAMRAARLVAIGSGEDAEQLLKQRDRRTPETRADLTLVNDDRATDGGPATAAMVAAPPSANTTVTCQCSSAASTRQRSSSLAIAPRSSGMSSPNR